MIQTDLPPWPDVVDTRSLAAKSPAPRASIMGPTPKPPTVRAAVEADESAILELVRLDIEENARHIAPVSEAKVMDMVRSATQGGTTSIGVIDGPNGLVAMICLVPYSWWWSEQWFVQEMWAYVHPDHRRSRHIYDLIKYSRWFVDAMSENVGYRVYLVSGVTGTRNAERKVALYGRLLNYVGAFFAYPDPTAS